MHKSIRALCAASLLAGTALAATPAFADEDASDFTISGGTSLVTDYRFRGVSQSGDDLAIQGTINVTHSTGIYVGTWASSLEELNGYGSTEVDLYAGWKGEVMSGLTADVGLTYYWYPNSGVGDDLNIWEPYVKLSTTLGPVSGTLGVAYSPDQSSLDFGADGGNDDNLYIFTDLSAAIPGMPITVSGHLGYTDGAITFVDDGSAFDWSVGASYAVTKNVSVGVSYIGVEADHSWDHSPFYTTKDTVVGTLSLSF